MNGILSYCLKSRISFWPLELYILLTLCPHYVYNEFRRTVSESNQLNPICWTEYGNTPSSYNVNISRLLYSDCSVECGQTCMPTCIP